jgi:hypothetical protein
MKGTSITRTGFECMDSVVATTIYYNIIYPCPLTHLAKLGFHRGVVVVWTVGIHLLAGHVACHIAPKTRSSNGSMLVSFL